jgi:adenosylhomocysteine nucleosidase
LLPVDEARVRRVGMLAPMEPELQPLIRRLGLQADSNLYRGTHEGVEVVAMLTTIGMSAATRATRRMLECDVDWVMVVGVAGGVDHGIEIGSVIVPEVVLDRASGDRFTPAPAGDIEPRGILSCGDELITDPAAIAAMEQQGVVAVDMETAAVAAVCEETAIRWSVFRGISDFADGGLVDDALFAMTRPDGTADPEAITRYLAENPDRRSVLEQLARDAGAATNAAADAAARAVAELSRR